MLKIWTRHEFDQEGKRQAILISAATNAPVSRCLEYVKEMKTGLEVYFLWDRDTIGSA